MASAQIFTDVNPPSNANDGDLWLNPTTGGLNVWRGGPGGSFRRVLLATSPSLGIGYGTGAGGAVTQATNKQTGVTINRPCGAITMNNETLNAGVETTFTVTNSVVGANDVIALSILSGGTSGSYVAFVGAVAAGSFDITLSNVSGGNLTEAVVIGFAVIKAVNA